MFRIGIDIGGTKIKCGLFSQRNQLLYIEEIQTPKHAIVEQIISTLKTLIAGKQIIGIGVASAGIVDFKQGMITSATNLPSLEKVPLKDVLEMTFHVPVIVDNDANCAALAEGVAGRARSVRNYICITLGTGIGGGIIHNKRLVHGKNGFSGEVGHMSIFPDGIPCNCGKKGCWEKYASGKALERMIQSDPHLVSKKFTPKQLFERYLEDDASRKIIDQFIEYLSIGIVNLQYLIDPEMIVVGGGVINSSEQWWDALLKKVANTSSIPVNLQQAELKNDASMIGANLLINNDLVSN
ncbi:ROK family protein [Alkalihalobacillus sp. TS-13]|uniref:ROK family protein n=1 Tax=Alkalihalobacillus sp. TS-13 TaxID=2842455 RepID=UPI001C868B10|nr:ROK family protein [Alkalihalobacillus sp. TS-13]